MPGPAPTAEEHPPKTKRPAALDPRETAPRRGESGLPIGRRVAPRHGKAGGVAPGGLLRTSLSDTPPPTPMTLA